MMHGATEIRTHLTTRFDHGMTMPNMPMRTSILLLLGSATLMACLPGPPDRGPLADPCEYRTADAAQGDGYPFDVNAFQSSVKATLAGCELGAACHGAGTAIAFKVFSASNPDPDNCPDVKLFNQVFDRSNYMEGGAQSAVVQKIDGTLAGHIMSAPTATALQGFIDAARANFLGLPPPVDAGIDSGAELF
jgi:hypothetical protein